MTTRAELLVVGAGPFGLAIAAYARRLGVEPLVVGEPMAFWKSQMPAGMCLRSGIDWHLDPAGEWTIARFLHERSLTADAVTPLPLATYLDYTAWFARRSRLDIVPSLVERLDSGPGGRGFVATLNTGDTVHADRAAVAVGFHYFAHVPRELAGLLPAGCWEHTCTAVDLAALRNKRCLLVGGRQSAFEWAALLGEAGASAIDVTYRHDTPAFASSHWEWAGPLVARFVDEPGWYRALTQQERDALAYRFWSEGRLKLEPWLTPRLHAGGVRPHPNTAIAAAAPLGGAVSVSLSDGTALVVDRVILATGYKPALDRVPFLAAGSLLSQIAVRNGSPVLDDAMQSTVPGLFFTSLLAADAFGPFFAFTVSARAAAQLICRAVAPRR